jgi:hypothetical protein
VFIYTHTEREAQFSERKKKRKLRVGFQGHLEERERRERASECKKWIKVIKLATSKLQKTVNVSSTFSFTPETLLSPFSSLALSFIYLFIFLSLA